MTIYEQIDSESTESTYGHQTRKERASERLAEIASDEYESVRGKDSWANDHEYQIWLGEDYAFYTHSQIRARAREHAENFEPAHYTNCICADCAGAELTAEND